MHFLLTNLPWNWPLYLAPHCSQRTLAIMTGLSVQQSYTSCETNLQTDHDYIAHLSFIHPSCFPFTLLPVILSRLDHHHSRLMHHKPPQCDHLSLSPNTLQQLTSPEPNHTLYICYSTQVFSHLCTGLKTDH